MIGPHPGRFRSLRLLALVCGLAAAAVPACSVPTSELPHPGTCGALQLVEVVPAPNAVDVPGDVVLSLTFNDFPNPDTIDAGTMVLFTGFYYHTGTYWVDLVDRRALYRPSGWLMPDLGYTLVVRPQIRSLRGCKLEAPAALPGGTRPDLYTFRFTIAAPGTGVPPSPPEPPPPPATYGEVVELFAQHCAGSACHLDTSEGKTSADPASCLPEVIAGGRLSLCARDARQDLVGVPSRQIARLVRVAPQDSSRSYLLRKLIGAPPVVGHLGVPGDQLSQHELRRVQSWIDTGARGPAAPADGAAPDSGVAPDGGAPEGGVAPDGNTPDRSEADAGT